MLRKSIALLLCFLAAAVHAAYDEEYDGGEIVYTTPELDFTPQAKADAIKRLPGLKATQHRRMHSGYIPVEGEGRALFYWLLESDLGFSNAPVILWTNGGPGCSGMLGLLTEQGPFQPTALGKLEKNPHAWTKVASMVFIEQPVGVGFSKTSRPLREVYGDSNAARDNYQFVLNFFKRYPELRTNEFYISSESYGGHYLPTLAKEIVVRGDVPNFKGLFVGNPLITGPLRDYGEFMTLHGHDLIPKPLFDTFHEAGCKKNIRSAACQVAIAQSRMIVRDLDPYALDFPKCPHGALEKVALLTKLGVDVPRPQEEEGENAVAVTSRRRLEEKYKPCLDTFATRYLNRIDVRLALHVKTLTKWSACNNFINVAYNSTDVEASMIPIYEFLMDKPGIKVWIYSGDNDSVCPTSSDQEWIWKYAVTSKWSPWKVDGQVAGFAVKFKGFSYYTVHGAGHMVPSTRPKESLDLLKKFLRA